MPKIIYVSNTDWYLYNFRLSLIKEMMHRGWDVVALAPASSYIEKLEKEGVRFHSLKMDRKGKNPFKDLLLVWKLFRIYKNEHPDIVHHFTIKPVIYGSFAARLLPDISVVNAVTGLGYVFKRKGIMQKIVEILYRMALTGKNYAIFQNPENLTYFVKNRLIRKERAWLIRGSGVDIQRFAPVATEEAVPSYRLIFLMASRMLWDKGVKEFVGAAKVVKERFPEAVFWLVGGVDDGNPSSVPEKWLREQAEGKIIKWWNHQDNILPFIQKADVVVLPTSYPEGVPKILLEGAAMAKPIIATDIPGCREIVTDGENGLLIPVKDVKKLAEAMNFMIENPGKRLEMGKTGREKAIQEFSDEIVIKKTIEVYDKIMAERTG